MPHTRFSIRVLLASLLVLLAPGVHAQFASFYPGYAELLDWMDAQNASDVVATFTFTEQSAGGDVEPQDVKALRISANPDVDRDRMRLLFASTIHGDEALGTPVLIRLVEEIKDGYLANDPEVLAWLDAYELWIVPVVNPRGYIQVKRYNGSLVDLNRNFDFRWDRCGSTDTAGAPCAIGSAPFSEPESRNLRDLVLAEKPVAGLMFHSGTGDAKGRVFRPWSRSDRGADDSTAADDPVVNAPVDTPRIIDIGGVLAEGVRVSRNRAGGPTCATGGPLPCEAPEQGVSFSTGQNNNYNYAKTGMFDYVIEVHKDDFSEGIFHAENPVLDATERARMDLAQEYVRNYTDGIKALLRHLLFSASPLAYRGPGIDGITVAHDGSPLPATVKILELDTTLDVDFEPDGVTPLGGPDLEYRTADRFGRFFRLLPAGLWTLECSRDGYPSAIREVQVANGAMEPVTCALQNPPVAHAGPDSTYECSSPVGARVTLNGEASMDPDSTPGTNNDIRVFDWIEDDSLPGESFLGRAERLDVTLELGSHDVTLRVFDRWDETDVDGVRVTVEDTTSPVVICPDTEAVVECTAPGQTPSSDSQLTAFFAAFDVADACDTSPSAALSAPNAFPLGTTSVSYASTDASGNSASCDAGVRVVDTRAPTVRCPAAPANVECKAIGGTSAEDGQLAAFLATFEASDVCDASPATSLDIPGFFALGISNVTYQSTDASGNGDRCSSQVIVSDTLAPTISVSVSPETLWPPNNKFVEIVATITVEDTCDGSPSVRLLSVSSNEDSKPGGAGARDGDVADAALGEDDRAFRLRAARKGSGQGRIYTVVYEVTDASGNSATASSTVTVAHDARMQSGR